MPGQFAQSTTVSVERTRIQIEKDLKKYGATGFGYYDEGSRATIAFKYAGRGIRFVLALPDEQSPEFALTQTGKRRSDEVRVEAHAKACRANWRALHLMIKATLEAVAVGIVTFDQAFMQHFVLPGGQTVLERFGDDLEKLGTLPVQNLLSMKDET